MTPVEYQALKHRDWLEQTVFVKADRLGPLQTEVDLLDSQRQRHPLHWFGACLVGAGARFVRLGKSLAARDAQQPGAAAE